MANPILIDIMLWDNDPEGTLRCELNSKDLILYRISRAELSSMRNHQELKQCGIYFLFGEESGKPVVYIGQANFRKNMKGVLGRVEEHDKPSEPYWDTAVMAVSKSDSIGATELNYLENQCVEKTSNAGRYTLKNSNSPTIGKVSTKTQILMDEFIDDRAMPSLVMPVGSGTLSSLQFSNARRKSPIPDLLPPVSLAISRNVICSTYRLVMIPL